MAATAISIPKAGSPLSYMLRLYANEVKYEFLKLWRNKGFTFSTIGFPIMFYLLFGVTNRHWDTGSFPIAPSARCSSGLRSPTRAATSIPTRSAGSTWC